MRYFMKSGVLYEEASRRMLAKIKSAAVGPVKKIYCEGAAPVLKTDIRRREPLSEPMGSIRNKAYLMTDGEDHAIAVGRPAYAEGDDPAEAGWPVCRMPRVDRAEVAVRGTEYLLIMQNSQNYTLRDMGGNEALRIVHRGIAGGWNIEDDVGFPPEILCGIFVFCRYIEQENEFLVV